MAFLNHRSRNMIRGSDYGASAEGQPARAARPLRRADGFIPQK